MCGITLYISKNNTNAILKVLESLFQLQNRGYDSFGIAYLENNNYNLIKYSKNCVNENIDLFEYFKQQINNLFSNICIGHSRWATHGNINKQNSHPHISNNKQFICIHNGIIENYYELKQFLLDKKYTFYSETDTEVIINLIEYYYQDTNDFQLSIQKAVQLLNGTYGLILLDNNNKDNIFIIKNGSPLIISETNEAILATSELCGFNNNTKNYYEIDNNELIHLSIENGIQFINKKILKQIDHNFNNHYLTQELKHYSHYTQKEIHEQDKTLNLTLNNGGRIYNNQIKLGGIEILKQHLNTIKNIVFLGCGSSYYAANIGYHYIKKIDKLNDINVFCFDGCDFQAYDIPYGKCLFVFISQSGETMDLIKHLNLIKQNHITMGIINVIDSTIAKEVDCGIYMNIGKEVAVASTKSFNSSLLLLKLFSLWLLQEKTNDKNIILNKNVQQINQLIFQIRKINHEINIQLENIDLYRFHRENIFILGKGSLEYIAKECALKLKEICYIHGEGFSGSSLKHGPMALIRRDFPVILLINHENYEKMINTYNELKSRNAYIFILTSIKEINKIVSKNTIIINIPENTECCEILFMLVLQHLCYNIALLKKINPDKPKNLAKVVTVE